MATDGATDVGAAASAAAAAAPPATEASVSAALLQSLMAQMQAMQEQQRQHMEQMQRDQRVFYDSVFRVTVEEKREKADKGDLEGESDEDLSGDEKDAADIIQKIERNPLIERKAFIRLPVFTNKSEDYENWRFIVRGVLDTVPMMKKHLDKVEEEALKPANLHRLVIDMRAYADLEWDPTDDPDRYQQCLLMQKLSEGVYTCLQSLVSGPLVTMLRNLEGAGPSRGFEAWARLLRDYKGENGPRLLRLADAIFCPKRVKVAEVQAAMETFESLTQQFQTGEGVQLGQTLKVFGLLRLLPVEMAQDFLRYKGTIGMSYTETRKWVLDQVVVRREEVTKSLNKLEELTEPYCQPCGQGKGDKEWSEMSPEEQEAAYTELLAFRKGGKGGGDSAPFEGYCNYCGAWGHRLAQCRKLDQAMGTKGGSGKGFGKEGGTKGKGNTKGNQFGGHNFGGNGFGKSSGKGPYKGWNGAGGKGGIKGAKGLGSLVDQLMQPDAGAAGGSGWCGTYGSVPMQSLTSRLRHSPPGLGDKVTNKYEPLAEEELGEPEEEGARQQWPDLGAAPVRPERANSRWEKVARKKWRTVTFDEELEAAAQDAKEEAQKEEERKNKVKGKIGAEIGGSAKSGKGECKPLCPFMVRELAQEIEQNAPREGQSQQLMPLASPTYKEERDGWTLIKACMDSGAHVSALPLNAVQGYAVKPSAGQLRGQYFVDASGGELPNEGEQVLPTCSNEGVWTQQVWQVADITRPLNAISDECDKGQLVIFGKSGGLCLNVLNGERRYFPRVGGSYEMDMWIPPVHQAQGFVRQGA